MDNIAPGVPTTITAAYQASGVNLNWDDAPGPDFQFYPVYRGSNPSFVPSPFNLVQEVAASAWTDPLTNPWGQYYKITTLDIAGNESEAGSPVQITGVQRGAAAARTALLGAAPNPFNPSTTLAFEMAAAGHVRMKVYDTAGHLVSVLVEEHRGAGLHEVVWDGRDATDRMSAAGVYLYQLEWGRLTQTKRMVLVR